MIHSSNNEYDDSDSDSEKSKITIINGKECCLEVEQLHLDLDAIGYKLAKTRSEAIAGRQDSGIEEEWMEDEEYYEGIDDANRRELKAWRGKPLGSQLPLDEDSDDRGSTIFLNITRPYVDGAAARMGDMLLPTNDRGWSVKPTPKPDLIDLSEGKIPDQIQQSIEADNPDDPERQKTQIAQAVEQANKIITLANESAKKVEKQIWDWHIESQYNAENRRIIEDAAKVGTGILKGPIPEKTSKMVFRNGKLEQQEEIKPVSRRIFYRNFYPDPACGENIHNGNYTFERDDITRSSLELLIDVPGYVESQISKVIKEGPQQATKEFNEEMDTPGLSMASSRRKNIFEIWYFHGSMRRKDLITLDIMSGKDDLEFEDDSYIHVQVTMVNNRVIKATPSHLQNGDFPYDVMIWQRRMGIPFGIGIARQIRPAQRIVVGATRHMMDNAGIAGGPMVFIDLNVVQPAEGPNEIKPWKVFVPADDYEGGNDVREAIQFITAPMMQKELQAIIELGLKVAEDVTGMPLIMQGQTNQKTPTTLGGMVLQNNNASTVLRRVARLYDDLITEPHIRRYYNHILEYSEDDSMKGEFNINALGSSALIERETANQALMQFGDLIQNPMYGKDPIKWMDEVMKANKLDPARLEYDDEEWKEIVQGMQEAQQQPADPKLEIAQMNKEIQELRIQTDAQIKGLIAKTQDEAKDKDRESKENIAVMSTADKEKDRAHNASMLQLAQQFEIYVAQVNDGELNERQLNDIKQKINDTVMKLQTQVQLSGTEALTPPVEPKGRAKDGKSFTE